MENIFLAVKKLAPQVQINNPVMFVVYVGAILLTVIDGVNAVTGRTISHWVMTWRLRLFYG